MDYAEKRLTGVFAKHAHLVSPCCLQRSRHSRELLRYQRHSPHRRRLRFLVLPCSLQYSPMDSTCACFTDWNKKFRALPIDRCSTLIYVYEIVSDGFFSLPNQLLVGENIDASIRKKMIVVLLFFSCLDSFFSRFLPFPSLLTKCTSFAICETNGTTRESLSCHLIFFVFTSNYLS